MADAAYQTIKTLQDMLDNKNQAIKNKEQQIATMRDNMSRQRNQDAKTIEDLRNQISMTGNTTLAKMQEIVSRHDISQTHAGQPTRAGGSQSNSFEELTRQLKEKDRLIQEFQSREQRLGKSASSSKLEEATRKINADRQHQIERLQGELMDAQSKNKNVDSMQKRIQQLETKLNAKDQKQIDLQKAIQNFQNKANDLASLKLAQEEKQIELSKKEQYQAQIEKTQKTKEETKLKNFERARDNALRELADLKKV